MAALAKVALNNSDRSSFVTHPLSCNAPMLFGREALAMRTANPFLGTNNSFYRFTQDHKSRNCLFQQPE